MKDQGSGSAFFNNPTGNRTQIARMPLERDMHHIAEGRYVNCAKMEQALKTMPNFKDMKSVWR